MNLETAPPALDALEELALPSGAVSSSWMWKRLMSVLTGHRLCLHGSLGWIVYRAFIVPLLYF